MQVSLRGVAKAYRFPRLRLPEKNNWVTDCTEATESQNEKTLRAIAGMERARIVITQGTQLLKQT